MRNRRRRWFVAAALVAIVAACTGVAARPQRDDVSREDETGARPPVDARAVAPVHTTVFGRYGTAADPLRVMVWGDSVAVTLEPVVEAALAALRDRAGVAEMLPRAALGFGLTSPYPGKLERFVAAPNFTDWRTRLAQTLHAERPDEVVMLIGTWDAIPRDVGGTWLQPGSARWRSRYEDLVTDAATRITATGAHVTWLTHPCVTDPARNRFLPAVNTVYRTVADRLSNVDAVDLAGIVCPGGRFDPATRTPEGTHFSLAAVSRLGPPLAAQFARVWKLPGEVRHAGAP